MRLLDQYIRLAEGLPTTSQQLLGAVAERLCCSERNARLLVQRMQAEGWLRWSPGRGRGQRSTLALLRDPAALRVQQLGRFLDEDRLEAAFHGLPPAARARLKEALPGFLGASPGGGLRMPFYRPLHSLDPVFITRRTEAHVVRQLCEGLTTYDREREAIVPALAHHWDSASGSRRWRLWLRPGLRFHDGRPVGAVDVAQSLLRLRDTLGPHRALLAHLAHIEIDGHRLELHLRAADCLLPHRLAHHAAVVLPADDWRRPDFSALPIGAGAFRLLRNNEYRATLRAFEGYWRERPLLDEIDLWIVHPGSKMPAVDLRHGQPTLPVDAASDAERVRWRSLRQPEQGCDFVLLNPARAAFATSQSRRDMGDWLRAHVASRLGPEHTTAVGWLPAWRHLPIEPSQRPPPRHLPRQLQLVTYELTQHIELSRAVVAACAGIGTQVHLDVLPYPVFQAGHWHAQADMVVAGEVHSDDIAFGQFSALAGESLFHAWLPTGLRRWLASRCRAIAAEPSAERRAAAVEAAFARLTCEGAVLPMRHTRQHIEHAPHVGGVTLARCGWMDFRKLWVTQEL
jgi:SgrR family transcriptional regulator